MMDALSLSSNQVSAPGIRAPLCVSLISLVVFTGTLCTLTIYRQGLSSFRVPTRRMMMMSRTSGPTALRGGLLCFLKFVVNMFPPEKNKESKIRVAPH